MIVSRINSSFAFAFFAFLITAGTAFAHCDGMDGPVVKAAQRALETGDVNPVLIWVPANDEQEITKAFETTLAVRKLNVEARDLADRYFFETLVRIHRAAEGAPYTGLKPAGRDLGPGIAAADRAIEEGSDERLVKLLSNAMNHGLKSRFIAVTTRKNFDKSDVRAGREFVKAYVEFIHYVEAVHAASAGPAPADHVH